MERRFVNDIGVRTQDRLVGAGRLIDAAVERHHVNSFPHVDAPVQGSVSCRILVIQMTLKEETICKRGTSSVLKTAV